MSRTIIILVVLCFAFIVQCKFNTLKGQTPLIIGHRGAPAYRVEETFSSYELAATFKPDFIETDLCITQDGVLVIPMRF